jgi:hypothetical protein
MTTNDKPSPECLYFPIRSLYAAKTRILFDVLFPDGTLDQEISAIVCHMRQVQGPLHCTIDSFCCNQFSGHHKE